MSKIDFLKEQIIESRNFVNRLVSEIPENQWYTIPEGTDSNFAWQIGHLIISQNFHAITCITGRNEAVSKLIPMVDYVKVFNGISNLSRLDDRILSEDLEPIPFKHPVANNKYEALAWCFKHEMWHSAEMEAIKRALGHPIKWM